MKRFFRNTTILLTGFGFLLVALFLWLDECLDLPARFFNAPPTPVNIHESIFETIVIGILAVLVMTAIHWLDCKVEQLKRDKAKILGIISHDLKNTFTSLIGHSRMLNNNPEQLTSEDYQQLSTAIYFASKKIMILMENLLHWSRIHSNILTVSPMPFPLAALVQSNITLMSHQADSKQIGFEDSVEPDLEVMADRNMIDSVIHNVLHNAVKFTPPSGRITLQAIEDKDTVQLIITNSGATLPEDVRKSAEGPQLPGNSHPGTHGEKGSGLGLYICREFMDRNHGSFSITASPQTGTTVRLTLPKAA